MERRHRVIYFDLDCTLVDYEADACHAFGKARDHALGSYPHLGVELTDEVFRRARQATYIQYGDTSIPLRDWYRECMRIVLEPMGVFDIELADRMGQIYGLFRNTTLRVFEDAIEVVPKLARVYKLGLLSNGSSRVEKLQIAEFFTYKVYAREVGHEKPSPEIFYAAARVAGCKNGEMLYVGDGQHTDIIGARNAGIEIVWINRTREQLLAGIPRPDYEIHDLREIFSIVPV
ncbi:MAG: HAD family hydrolase [Candidatus Abyssobacteria bacterium SURF_17]|uniref:HAD family hydrolase n=1 Tax=Candidatus Abyssobacteria bacterium SURF_17 TaxID=2093361 RepID=A0A419ES96_9BACT|nr:MAG: HAD family hydrolase [Candidatus Abyssubacteria bacterium SURF_17]